MKNFSPIYSSGKGSRNYAGILGKIILHYWSSRFLNTWQRKLTECHKADRTLTDSSSKQAWPLQHSEGVSSLKKEKTRCGKVDFKALMRSGRRRLCSSENIFVGEAFSCMAYGGVISVASNSLKIQGICFHHVFYVWSHDVRVQWCKDCFGQFGEWTAAHKERSPCCVRNISAVHWWG